MKLNKREKSEEESVHFLGKKLNYDKEKAMWPTFLIYR